MSPPPSQASVGVVGLVPDRWGPRWAPRHHVMSRLGQAFPVVWVNPAHHRDQLWSVARRQLLRNRAGSPDPAAMEVYDPDFWLPELYRPRWLSDFTLRARVGRAAARLRRRGARHIVLYIWRPHFGRAAEVFPADAVVYHIDDEYSFADDDVPNTPEEIALIRRADQVIVHSSRLLAKKGSLNPRTTLIPNGADFAAFTAPHPEPADLAGIPRPRAGYAGALKKHLDWTLLEAVATANPGVSFVFLGDRELHPEIDGPMHRMDQRPNVHFLGVRPSSAVPAYVQHFDICLLPYRRMGYTDYIYPQKLHEYLATGHPVLGTPIPSLEEFSSVVRLASDVEQWSAGLDALLDATATSTAEIERRRGVAAAYDWDLLVNRIADLIRELPGARVAA